MWVCYFPIGILGQVWYLIVLIPDICILTYFEPAAPRSRFKHSATEPLCSFDTLVWGSFVIYLILYMYMYVLLLDNYLGLEGRTFCLGCVHDHASVFAGLCSYFLTYSIRRQYYRIKHRGRIMAMLVRCRRIVWLLPLGLHLFLLKTKQMFKRLTLL